MSDVAYHAPGFTRSMKLAKSGKINRGKDWTPPPDPKPDDCLGVHKTATSGAKGKQAYPIVKGNTLYRAGVIAAKQRAAQQGEPEIVNACDKLLSVIDKDQAATAARPTPKKLAALRGPTAFSDKSVEVDEANGVIKNVALITVGPALGHPFEIDETTVDQLVALANSQADGVKCRFKHPQIVEGVDAEGKPTQRVADDTGTQVARIKNARKVGQQARGDVHLGSYAASVPGMGDVRQYLIDFAKDDPAGIGMSAFFSYHVDPVLDDFGNVVKCPARMEELEAIDFVGTPAANPRGLLSAKGTTFDPQPPSGTPNASGWQDPNPKDQGRAPVPANTAEFPHDVRGAYLREIVQHGPLSIGGLAARFTGRLEQMRATADWLVSHGYAERVNGRVPTYKATPSGITRMAAIGVWKGQMY